MAYDSQFVVCVLHNGSPVREIGRTIHLPFHSDYKVRIKNKQPFLRAKARVWIDGRQVSNLGDFILQPNETLDLERFLDESMTSGNKFKFVPLSDGRVNDPTDPENGVIKVEFYKETLGFTLTTTKEFLPPSERWADSGSININDTPLTFTNGGGTSSSINSCSINCVVSNSADSAGATVEGGYSGQSFTYGSDFETDFFPVTLELRIRGLARQEMNWEDRPTQVSLSGPKKRIKICPNCKGTRHGMAKFCPLCGTAYHPRYERERGRVVR